MRSETPAARPCPAARSVLAAAPGARGRGRGGRARRVPTGPTPGRPARTARPPRATPWWPAGAGSRLAVLDRGLCPGGPGLARGRLRRRARRLAGPRGRGARPGRATPCARSGRHRRWSAGLGPCIGPCCYEFSADDLDARRRRRRDRRARAARRRGRPSLDLPAAVRGQLARAGVVRWSSSRRVHGVHAGVLLAPGPRRRGPSGAVRLASPADARAVASPVRACWRRRRPPRWWRHASTALRRRIEDAGRDPATRARGGGDQGLRARARSTRRCRAGSYDIGENYADELLAKAATPATPTGESSERRPTAVALPRCRPAPPGARLAPVVSCWQTLSRVVGGRDHRVARARGRGARGGGHHAVPGPQRLSPRRGPGPGGVVAGTGPRRRAGS